MTISNICIVIGFWLALGLIMWVRHNGEKKRIQRRKERFERLRTTGSPVLYQRKSK